MTATIWVRMSETSLAEEMKRRRGESSLRDMAKACGIGSIYSTLGRIERGEIETPSRETLEAISVGYGLPLEYLAQLVYLGRPAAGRETPSNGTPPAENEPTCEVKPEAIPPKRRLAVIS